MFPARSRGARPLACALPCLLLWAIVARADVITDGSVGAAGPVGPGIVSGIPVTHAITEDLGQRSDANLLHSFSDFTLVFDSAGFSADSGLPTENIIARVTGGIPSLIDGLLVVGPPGAQLFLINPSGVVFGDNAELNVPSSLHVSTAHFLRFADGSLLDMQNPIAGPLSSASVAAYGFLNQPIASITVEQPRAALTVPAGGTLSFVGGDVAITGGGASAAVTMKAPSGRVQLASAAGPIEIPTDVSLLNPAAVPEGSLGDISLSQFAFVDTSGEFFPASPSGTIVIRGGKFVLSSGSLRSDNLSNENAPGPAVDIAAQGEILLGRVAALDPEPFSAEIRSQSVFAGEGGSIILEADRIALVRQPGEPDVKIESFAGGARGADLQISGREVVVDGGLLRATASGAGRGGDVVIDSETLDVRSDGLVLSTAESSGQGGDIRILSDDVVLDSGVVRACVARECRESGSNTNATGQGGSVIVDTGSLTAIHGGQVSASTLATEGDGNAGSVQVIASGDVLLSGVREGGQPSGVFSRSGNAGIDSTGNAGDISIDARSVTLAGGAEVSARTFGRGDAGSATVRADDFVRIQGSGPDEASLLSTRGDFGDGGDISVVASRLEVLDGGQVTASTNRTGEAGDIEIRVGQLSIGGPNPVQAANPTGIFAQSNAGATGSGGDIDIQASGALAMFAGGKISAETKGAGQGGDATISAQQVLMTTGSEISTRASGDTEGVTNGDAGDIKIHAGYGLGMSDSAITTEAKRSFGGNIDIQALKIVNLLRSSVTTTVGTGDGRGGDITIDPEFVVLNKSAIIANADLGTAGNISIDAGQFVISQDSVVQATNRFDAQGEIRITSPDTDLINEVTRLSGEFLDASALLASTCADPTGPAGSFVVRKRGWIPASPDAPLGGFLP